MAPARPMAGAASTRWNSSRRWRTSSCRTCPTTARRRSARRRTARRRTAMVDRVLRGSRADAPKKADEPRPSGDPKAEMWRRGQLARNLGRPRSLELLREMADDIVELHGDRLYGDDPAVVAGFARL